MEIFQGFLCVQLFPGVSQYLIEQNINSEQNNIQIHSSCRFSQRQFSFYYNFFQFCIVKNVTVIPAKFLSEGLYTLSATISELCLNKNVITNVEHL